MTATWQPNPHHCDYVDDLLVAANGDVIGRVEDFCYACYPMALNAATGNWERGGAYYDRVEAVLWAERVGGEHPASLETKGRRSTMNRERHDKADQR